MSAVLVINSGSSSFKYQLIDMESETALASGLVERIGEPSGHTTHRGPDGTVERSLPIVDHTAGFAAMLEAFQQHGPSLDEFPPIAIGHRVVHGGKRFFEPTVVTPLVELNIEDLADLAPLHNPANLEGIRAAIKAFPGLPNVAVFDTAFHQTLAPEAYTYAIDAALAERHRVRRYGFHGTSHKYVSETAAGFLGRPLGDLKQIVLHLGNGASACAIDGGRSVDTSMGMTPLEGLVMGTRSGDIDPAVLLHLSRRAGLGTDELDELLNRRSGLLGLSGRGDMRDVTDAQPAHPEPGEKGCGAHTDFGSVTLLLQDAAGGLQVRDVVTGTWFDAPPVPETFVVNLGDLIARWTNHRFQSNPHRVVNRSSRERYSVPFFFTGNPDYVVECLPTCLAPGEAPQYPPITAEAHLAQCYAATYG